MALERQRLTSYRGFAFAYSLARGLRNAVQYKSDKDFWGSCNICGRYSCFRFHELLTPDSALVRSCGWDADFLDTINTCNTLDCSWCLSKFRVRCATDVVLAHFRAQRVTSLLALVKLLRGGFADWSVLETGSTGGVFSAYPDLRQLQRSEYFNDVPRGSYRDGVRSEDLQDLTFAEGSFDMVISLDVFEHIADPWRAFAEVQRVLKPGGVGIITVPIDKRQRQTRARAAIEDGKLLHHLPPSYHLDPLRREGALVFTEFGTDLGSRLCAQGLDASLRSFASPKGQAEQFVLVLHK